MQEVKIECEVITPMFLSGADGRTAELRPPSIKGAMRFWWRAIKAETEVKKLLEEESKIFGSSDENNGKSKFSIRVDYDNLNTSSFNPLPHKENERFHFNGLRPGQKFEIILTVKDKNYLDLCRNILDLTLLLGGLGKRSRRGFGSVMVNERDIDLSSPTNLLTSILSKLTYVTGHDKTYEIQNQQIKRKNQPQANYPFIKEIYIGSEAAESYNELLRKIGQSSHQFRDFALGSINPRMASPVYVSIVRINGGYYPIITLLNPVYPNGYRRTDQNKISNFIDSLK